MKLSFAFVSFAVATVGASSSSLRKKSAARKPSSLETKVVLKGVAGEPTQKDLDFISKAFVASYNDVHWEVGHLLAGDAAAKFQGCVFFLNGRLG
jgi:hypothetical protein